MVYRVYKDKKLICASEDKRKAFKVMRESFEQGSHYYVETEEDGVKEREQYYLAQRADGRVCVNKRSTNEKYNKIVREKGKGKQIGVWFNEEELLLLATAADNSGITIPSLIKSIVLGKLTE